LWIASDEAEIKAVCTTEIINYAQMKVCRICILTGRDFRSWTKYCKDIENWAKKEGCKRIESLARKGWAKIFKDYTMSHIFLEKEL
jgi:hypothetical protein